MIFLILLGTPDAPSMSLSVDNKPLDGKLAVVRHGQMIDLKCTSKGGNPVTSLSITKNGTAFGPEPNPFLNSHSFIVTKGDKGAFLGCKSENQNKWHSESWPVELNVLCKFCMTLYFYGFCFVQGVHCRNLVCFSLVDLKNLKVLAW